MQNLPRRVYMTLFVSTAISFITACTTNTKPANVEKVSKHQMPWLEVGDEVKVEVIPVGNGSCHAIKCPGDGTHPAMGILEDCGTTAGTGGEKAWTEEQIVNQAADALRGHPYILVMTHADADHTNLIGEVVDRIKQDPSEVYYGGDSASYAENIEAALFHLHNDGVPIHGIGYEEIRPGDGPPCGSATTLILAVNAGGGDNPNADSLVLQLLYGGHSMLFPGDAVKRTQNMAMAQTFAHFPSEVVEASHHGSATIDSNSSTWAQRTAPKILIVSAGDRPTYAHPRCESINNYIDVTAGHNHSFTCYRARYDPVTEDTNSNVYNTFDSGLITVLIPPAGSRDVRVETRRDPPPRGLFADD